jgi:predicted HTH transcriptional regulator
VGQGEQVDVEFKSTAFVALRQVRETGANPRDCQSEGVLHSLLKTICGFLNKSGGEVFIGVEPSGLFCGLEVDYEVMSQGSRDFDGWSNRLQDFIRTRFHEGALVMNYIEFQRGEVDGVAVCRINIRARDRISFVKDGNGLFHCYVRENVRTEEKKIQDIPDFIEARRVRE